MKKRISFVLVFLCMLFINPMQVLAEEATITFGSEEYTPAERRNFQVGVYINGDARVGEYYVEVKYDNRRMEYVNGGTREEDGTVILEGTGTRNRVKYMLTFRPLSGGEAKIWIADAKVYLSGDENLEAFDITLLDEAPIMIAGEDTVGPLEEEETDSEEESLGIPVSGKTTVDGVEYYLLDLAEIVPTQVVWKYELEEGIYEERDVTYLTDAEHTISFLYLMDEEEELHLFAYSADKEKLYPVNEIVSNGEHYYFMSPYVCEVWPDELTLDLIKNESIVYAMDEEGNSDFYTITTGNALAPWRADTSADSVYEQTMKLMMVLVFALLVIALVVFLYVYNERSKHKRYMKDRQKRSMFDGKTAAELGLEDLSLDVTPDEILEWRKEALENKEAAILSRQLQEESKKYGEPVISVQNVSMDFKIATSNVSGIKEYVIQVLKKQISYRELKALSHVNFNVYKGEVVGIIGTNGSGKSTLLRIVSGALKPSSGTVVVDHKKVQLLTLGTGFDMELTAKENVYLNGAIIGYTKEFIDERYDEIVAFAELEGFMEEKVKNFSSGMVSRLGFAIATVGDAAEILILDEVLSVGDEFFRKKSLKRVKEMIHGGSTVLMVSHSMDTILENCSKVVWIEKGEMRMIDEPQAVCAAYRKMNEGK